MHAHVPGGQASDADIERVLFMYVAHGITTARSMLGHPRHLPLRARLASGDALGPRLYTSGPSFNGNSVPTAEAADRMVREQKDAGYDFLKIHPGVKRDVFDTLASTATAVGIRFAGHVPLDVGLARALEARYATIDHIDGYVEALVRSDAPVKASESQWFGVNLVPHLDLGRLPGLVADTRKAGTWIVPTESLMVHTVSDTDPAVMATWPEMAYVPAPQIAQWTETKRKFLQWPADTRRGFLDVRKRLLKTLHAGGVGLLLGSDAPQMWNVPGVSIHRELRVMVEAGLTPWQALETGTRNVARFFGIEDSAGTIAAGKRADLVLLDASPLQDIGNSSTIAGVMVGGRWLPRADIDRRLEGYKVAR
jgi:imidazolonepropionase-like amidohydrolase